MRNAFFLCVSCIILSSCNTITPNRPDYPTCFVLREASIREGRAVCQCTDGTAETPLECGQLIGTTLTGLETLENYIDDLEKTVITCTTARRSACQARARSLQKKIKEMKDLKESKTSLSNTK